MIMWLVQTIICAQTSSLSADLMLSVLADLPLLYPVDKPNRHFIACAETVEWPGVSISADSLQLLLIFDVFIMAGRNSLLVQLKSLFF